MTSLRIFWDTSLNCINGWPELYASYVFLVVLQVCIFIINIIQLILTRWNIACRMQDPQAPFQPGMRAWHQRRFELLLDILEGADNTSQQSTYMDDTIPAGEQSNEFAGTRIIGMLFDELLLVLFRSSQSCVANRWTHNCRFIWSFQQPVVPLHSTLYSLPFCICCQTLNK